MPGLGSSSQQTSQNTVSNPWAPAQPALKGILSGIQGQLGNYMPTATETDALSQINKNAQNLPNYGGQVAGLASSYLGGDPSGLLSPALKQYQQQLSPYANGQNLDPMQSPGMAQLLATIRNDVGSSVNQQFAGAGRDLSGLNQQALARGIAQGEAAPLLAQYNQNVQNQLGAANSLYGAAGQTAGALGANQAQGLGYASSVPQFQNQGATSVLAAQQLARGLPLNNLGMLENLTVPIAGLGGQTQSNGTATYNPSLLQMGAGLFGGGVNSVANGILGFLSDRRAKDDIEAIGKLNDGTPVYRFRYKGDPRIQIGLMADDVEKYAPDAISEHGGFKFVDYDRATDRARRA